MYYCFSFFYHIVILISKKNQVGDHGIDTLVEAFAKASDDTHNLSRAQFHEACLRLKKAGLKVTETPFEDRLFAMFDKDGDGQVNLTEFLCGMAVLIKGSEEERLYLTFRAFDLNGDNSIDKSELKRIFKQAWLTGLFQLVSREDLGSQSTGEQGETAAAMENYADELAEKFAEKAFTTLDVDRSGGLTFQEFRCFASHSPKITTQVNGLSKEVAITLMHSASDALIQQH